MQSMMRRIAAIAPILALLLALAWWFGRRALDPAQRGVEVIAGGGEAVPAAAAPAPGAIETDRDREIFLEKMAWARAERLDTLPIGEIVARLGRTFVGTKYTPHTLEVDGPERLVVNLRELDCVTFVESTLAMARLIHEGKFDDYGAYKRELARIRYRDGIIDGYASRLHYFSDWIANGEAKGLVRDVTREIGGVLDDGPIDFMSTHRDAYRQLADPATLEAIRRVEAAASARPRYFIPETRIADAAPRIRNGDIIAATSNVDGLDVAHTGIALWIDGRLHLLHAPLVGKSVEISELPLAERILDIDGQDGIMVARPS
ncbi:MAG TPA: N-acetylmuramoyl-L-alanine amidase-like domain-containing protein [Longimicrobiales bacterium]